MIKNIDELKVHEWNKGIFGDEKLSEEFLDSIKQNGIRESLVIKEDGTIISGHKRLQAAQELKIQQVLVRIETYNSEIEEREAFIDYNRYRDKTFSQKISEAIFIEETEKLKARERQQAALKQGNKNPVPEIFPEREKGESRDKIAKQTGLGSGRHYSKAKKIWDMAQEGDELAQKIIDGIDSKESTINKGYNNIRREQKRQEVKTKEKEHEQELAKLPHNEIDVYNTDKKFNIIYADPPWKYWEGGQKNQSLHYPTMTIDEICELPVANIADDNAILFLWVTYPILFDALKVIESWGFVYSTCAFVWAKRNPKSNSWFFGNGAWTRANTELCLLAKRGHVTRKDASISQIIDAPVGEHSTKPLIIKDKIIQLVGALPRIELFSRSKEKDGWFNWGNRI